MAFAAAGRTAFFLTIADPLFTLLCSSPDRGAVTGKSQMVWIDQFGWLHLRETVLGRKVVIVILLDTGKEIIKSADTRGISEGETAEDGIKRSFPEHTAPASDGSYFQL